MNQLEKIVNFSRFWSYIYYNFTIYLLILYIVKRSSLPPSLKQFPDWEFCQELSYFYHDYCKNVQLGKLTQSVHFTLFGTGVWHVPDMYFNLNLVYWCKIDRCHLRRQFLRHSFPGSNKMKWRGRQCCLKCWSLFVYLFSLHDTWQMLLMARQVLLLNVSWSFFILSCHLNQSIAETISCQTILR